MDGCGPYVQQFTVGRGGQYFWSFPASCVMGGYRLNSKSMVSNHTHNTIWTDIWPHDPHIESPITGLGFKDLIKSKSLISLIGGSGLQMFGSRLRLSTGKLVFVNYDLGARVERIISY